MSEDQLSALLAKLKEDTLLQEKLKGASDLDAALTLAREAGFDVSQADFVTHELHDEELESVTGGRDLDWFRKTARQWCLPH
jgi:predicted ribosomally synthesized peptide with nif11-like leader